MYAPYEEWKPCARCGDFGILRAIVKGQKIETLIYCTCEWRDLKANIWKLPQPNRAIYGAFDIQKCPLAWFLPDNERESIPRGQLIASLGPIIDAWKARVRAAEEFWKENGDIFMEGA